MARGGVAWLSSSNAEISRARDVLKSLTPGGVIDELGFLILNAAFADHFYPAVTTPMTRARYLIFVPAIYQHLEQTGQLVGRDADRISRDLQFDLLKALVKNEREGVIGKESGRNIVRVPSEIYWNALAALGIATQRISESSYQGRLTAGTLGLRVWRDDDKAAHSDDPESLWNPSLKLSHIAPGGIFPESTSFQLRKAEATFLQSRYATLRPRGRESLVTHMVTLANARTVGGLDGIDHLWNIPDLPPDIAAAADHARRLSLFARGVTLQYYRMLIDKKGEADSGVSAAFESWWAHARSELRAWNVDAFFVLLQQLNAVRRSRDREFIKGWIDRCVGVRSGRDALDDGALRTIVSNREDYVRPGKQRLKVRYQLDSWRPLQAFPSDVFYQLEYRHRVGRVIAQDISDGIGRGAA